MSIKVTFRLADGSARVVVAEPGTSVMRVAVENGVPGIVGECGGEMSCATCHVHVDPDLAFRSMSADEEDMLEAVDDRLPTSRLGCQLILRDELGEIAVTVPS
ncbi:2Fe-2S iron-sulfur cluster-binding protein [Pseudofrankia inefficax]|uniref:Ferredoxin n=1 Tax=Pseudofrankia inefficax (strain DSM 45817 / CECT 9037 / DDB 130130 / EuI1c) TaxID=298654 RepID=E3IU47_PSEI1|nr:2Fe-2S iron-sulfur cluster-binding protein [Pseudofrankia inefficax]ADP81240.1 ferredoxin [Pseudofrankia inefficax]